MRNGIVATSLDLSMPFAQQINARCSADDWFPYVVAACQKNETGSRPDAATVISGDGGHGVMQLTASYPDDWADPAANIDYAIMQFLKPAEDFWAAQFQGEELVKAIAAEYNAGRGKVLQGHEEGDLDKYTTEGYGARALATYEKLCAGEAV
jgi:hypothetical protein